MKTIVLCCSAGMSTSMLVKKMQTEAENRKMEITIVAVPKPEIKGYIENADVILLGPQIRYALTEVVEVVNGKIPVDVIDVMDYGTMNGAKVLDKAIGMMK